LDQLREVHVRGLNAVGLSAVWGVFFGATKTTETIDHRHLLRSRIVVKSEKSWENVELRGSVARSPAVLLFRKAIQRYSSSCIMDYTSPTVYSIFLIKSQAIVLCTGSQYCDDYQRGPGVCFPFR